MTDAIEAALAPAMHDSETEQEEEMQETPSCHRDKAQHLRTIEAMLFAASEPLDEAALASRLPEDADVPALLAKLVQDYAARGVNLLRLAGKWAFRTAPDLAFLLRQENDKEKRLSRAAAETLAIIAYHQPVTRAEIEEIRGVSVSKGTLELLLETTWIRPRGRRRSPGRPLTFGTTEAFEIHFGLDSLKDLPGLEELKAAGMLDLRLPPEFRVSIPDPGAEQPDEDPLDPEDPLNEFNRAGLESGQPERPADPSNADIPSNVIDGPGLRKP
ncbi:MAG: SMC-Scp complex subunit ScpB [Pseudomonadota bacterium]|jgi:segregation and condensation protein B